jgi:hypothetical protein
MGGPQKRSGCFRDAEVALPLHATHLGFLISKYHFSIRKAEKIYERETKSSY